MLKKLSDNANVHRQSIAILQPFIPHYRQKFFEYLRQEYDADIYLYEDNAFSGNYMRQAYCACLHVVAWGGDRLLAYNPLPFLKRKYKVLVLMGSIRHVTTWLLLLLAPLLGKKIILWSHGISCSRYLEYQHRLPWFYRLFFRLSSGVWLYTEAEQQIWQQQVPTLLTVALGNTLNNVEDMLNTVEQEKEPLKRKYRITTPVNLVFCARFMGNIRRIDLLLEVIRTLPAERFGFIIIGGGKEKPDFSSFPNVYDFGAVYDDQIKRELFNIADIYFQPGWLGLSLVEAMAYGKPILTFARSKEVFQCVEYYYLTNSGGGKIVNSVLEASQALINISVAQWREWGEQNRKYVKRHLTSDHMIGEAMSLLDKIQ